MNMKWIKSTPERLPESDDLIKLWEKLNKNLDTKIDIDNEPLFTGILKVLIELSERK